MLANSQRHSTISLAALILPLEEGRAVERGTHEKLMAVGGTYCARVRRQTATPEQDVVELGALFVK